MTDESAAMGSDQAVGNPQDEGTPRDKRSRDRYGRERKPRGERNDSVAPQTDVVADAPIQEDSAPRKSYFTQAPETLDADNGGVSATNSGSAPQIAVATETNVPARAISPVAEPMITPAATAPAVRAPERVAPAPVADVAVASAPATLLATAIGMPAVASYSLPVDQLIGIAQESGLTWVNSNAEKIAAVQAAIAAEPKPVHVPRERPPVIALDDRPLVLVETRLDLRDISLPFEETQPG